MTNEELLRDLRERIDSGAMELGKKADDAQTRGDNDEWKRCINKANGMMVVRDYLRGYQ